MNVVQLGKDPLQFVSSASVNTNDELLMVKYVRVQPQSPEFIIAYEGINQSVDIKISTFIFRAAPEPVISLHDFIMNTFVPQPDTNASIEPPPQEVKENGNVSPEVVVAQSAVEKIRVQMRLASVQGRYNLMSTFSDVLTNTLVILLNDIKIATLSLSTADVAILLRANTLRINARLGSLALSDDSTVDTSLPEFKDILSIEGGNFADFQYQTYDPEDKETYKGIKSSVYLSTGSLKLHYLEQPLHEIYLFMLKLAEFKGLYDAATEAAVQRASEIERMQFNVTIKSPIIIFPSDARQSLDVLTMRLGEIKSHNSYDSVANRIEASVMGIQLSSVIHYDNKPFVLRLIDDIDISAKVSQFNEIDRSKELDHPDTQVCYFMLLVNFPLKRTIRWWSKFPTYAFI